MIITIPIKDSFLFFPKSNGNIEKLKKEIQAYYQQGNSNPNIEIQDDFVKITLPNDQIEFERKKFNKLISLCENGQFLEAEKYVEELVNEFPGVSEYYRIAGQIKSELDKTKEGIDYLIDALRWDPKNVHALLMMGNLFVQDKDIETALKYYYQVLKIKPDDHITLNNIGAQLMQIGKKDEAILYFQKALKADPEYSNTYLALGLASEKDGNYHKAFEFALKAVSKSSKRDQVYQNSLSLALECSRNINESLDIDKTINSFIKKLTDLTGIEIKVIEDKTISTAAKIEFAENYQRNFHLVKYKPNYPAVSHLILHELTHLELAEEARSIDENQLFTSNQSNRSKFFYSYENEAAKLRKKGIAEEAITNYLSAMFDGLNSQIFNTPIDLFIEDRVYLRFKNFRPLQFLSLMNLIREGIVATTKKEIVLNAPKSILSISKTLNLVNALHFKTLFGIDMLMEHKPSNEEMELAEEMYKEFEEYRNDKSPGEEYELIQHWGEDLKLDNYFQLINETEHKQKDIDSVLSDLVKDPFNTKDRSNERKMKKFIEENSSENINMAVTMYMVDALEYFKVKSKPDIKKTAFEFATLGMAGIDPQKKNYSVPSIKESSFSGYKTLAYYYVSWAISIPEMLESLQMPFDKEYDVATKFLKH